MNELSKIWAELQHIFGIAAAAAPVVALADPTAAAGIGSAEAALALVSPTVNAFLANSATPPTGEQVLAGVNSALNIAVKTAVANNTITADKAAAVTAAAPALVSAAIAISTAVNKPYTPSA